MAKDKFGSFNLVIQCGNNAMRSNQDIARKLREVAHVLDEGKDTGTIMDYNGNSIGRFAFEEWYERPYTTADETTTKAS